MARRSRDTAFARPKAPRNPVNHPPPPIPISAFGFRCPPSPSASSQLSTRLLLLSHPSPSHPHFFLAVGRALRARRRGEPKCVMDCGGKAQPRHRFRSPQRSLPRVFKFLLSAFPISAFEHWLLPTIPPLRSPDGRRIPRRSAPSQRPANAPASWNAVALHRFSLPHRLTAHAFPPERAALLRELKS